MPPQKPANDKHEDKKKIPLDFPIVGIGASAGGLEPLIQLVSILPKDLAMALVIIQHLDPKTPSSLTEIIARNSKLPVQIVTDKIPITKSHIFVIPPDSIVSMDGDQLRLTPRAEVSSAVAHMPVDYFFLSLANTMGNQTVAVILSGLGHDGAMGIKVISSEGGVTFAQTSDSAKYPSMPQKAVSTGCIDFILPPKKIADEIIHLSKQLLISKPAFVINKLGETDEIDSILLLIKKVRGADFRHYKQTTIHRRVHRRMLLKKYIKIEDYLKYLEKNIDEIDGLYNDILINVTNFFRDSEVFDRLKKYVYPEILKINKDGPIRIWVPGCSTGEEAYSIAISLMEYLGDVNKNPDIQIFATDISEKAIQIAREGCYLDDIKDHVDVGRLKRFFTKIDNGFRISKSIRDICIFASQNIINDPPFSRVDIVSCRNLLIYFSAALQKKVFPILHYAMKPSGFLILGNSESASGFSEMFSVVDKKHKLFSKKLGRIRQFYEPMVSKFNEPVTADTSLKQDRNIEVYDEKRVLKFADHIMFSRLAPAGFVINDQMDVLQIRGDTSSYVAPSAGVPSFNLMKLLRDELRFVVRTLVQEAGRAGIGKLQENVMIHRDGGTLSVQVQVLPLKVPEAPDKYYVIVLSEQKSTESKLFVEDIKAKSNAPEQELNKTKTLELELIDTREQLQAIIEEYESTNEELKSTNEEILSSNEELQSTNEELQTAKEEVQSANEELTTVNEELQNRNEELARSNDDLTNLFKSTRIPLLMLGRDLRIRRYASPATEVFKIIESDIGRPLSDINASFDTSKLSTLVMQVIDTMQPVMKEVRSKDGTWYSMSIRPYVTGDNKIDGVVLTFINIHAIRTIVDESIQLYFEDIVRTVKEPLLVLNEKQEVQMANEAYYELFKTTEDKTLRKPLSLLEMKEWDVKELVDLIKNVLLAPEGFSNYRIEKHFDKIGEKVFLVSGREIQRRGIGTKMILMSIKDITEQIQMQQLEMEKNDAELSSKAKMTFLANTSHEIRTPLTAILGFVEQLTTKQDLNTPEASKYFKTIETNSKYLKSLIDDVLDISKIEAGELTLKEATYHLPTDIEEIADATQESCKNLGLEFTCDYLTPLPEVVVADSTKMRQILTNLLSNSMKATEQGHITLTIEYSSKEPEQEYMVFRVKDTGCGIDLNAQTKLFEPFQHQKYKSLSHKIGGTGLGLTISKKLAVLMGGDLRLVKSEPGEGCDFEATIGIKTPDGVRFINRNKIKMRYDDLTSISNLDGVNVLIIEDNPELQMLYRVILTHVGADVHMVGEGKQGVAAALEKGFDVVLMDIQLPDINGHEVVKKLRSKGYKNPIIALTAHALEEERERILNVGCDEFLTKPISANKLVNVVAAWTKSGRST